MRITQRSDGYSIDPLAVRPGSSDALFARTIDATQRAPLIKAQEAITTAVPKIIDSVPPPLLGTTLGLSLLAVMVATQRVRFRLAPVLMSAVLLLPVSNYHSAQTPPRIRASEVTAVEDSRPRRDEPRSFERFDWRFNPRVEEVEDVPEVPYVEPVAEPANEFLIPPEITEGVLPLVEMVIPEEWTDEEQLRILRRRAERLMEEIRKLRLEQEIEEQRRNLSHGLFQ
jgi:hypothetical protein